MKISACFLLTLFLLACGGAPNSGVSHKPANEDDLIARLSLELNSKPSNQAEKEQNAMLNHAIDMGLDVQRSKSGIYYNIIQEGNGPNATMEDDLTMHYKGKFLNGQQFDASINDEPLVFSLNSVIPAWKEMVPELKAGGELIMLVPSELAYGEKGFKKIIPPNTPLKFEMKLLKVSQKK